MEGKPFKRASRFDPPQPRRSTGFLYTEADFLIGEALDRHGMLPTPYLYAFTKHLRKDYRFLQHRLTKFYHGYCEHPEHRQTGFLRNENGRPQWGHTCEPLSLLGRDPRQWMNIHARYQHAVYHLAPCFKLLLVENQRRVTQHEFRRSNSFLHDFFLGCFTASVELQARRFHFREALLAKDRCPQSTRDETAPFYFPHETEKLYPDDLFGNEYEEGRSRFFALEIDCATESTSSAVPTSMESKLKAYGQVLRTAGYRRFGLPNISVLIATTKARKMTAILQCIQKTIEPLYRSRFLVKTFPTFDKPWRVPTEPLNVFGEWKSTTGEEDISRKASA